MLMNNVDRDVTENPHQLIVHGRPAMAANRCKAYDANGESRRASALPVPGSLLPGPTGTPPEGSRIAARPGIAE